MPPISDGWFLTSAFREKFYREFPSLKSYRKKGTGLPPDKLKSVIEHLDKQKIKMTCVVLKRHKIKRIDRELREKFYQIKKIPKDKISFRFFEEKIIASVYFTALCQHAWEGYPYNCFSCMETQFDTNQSLIALNRICYNEKFHFKVASIPRRTEHMIKFADYIASAGRKLDKFIIEKYPNFVFIDYEPNYDHLDVVFGLSRREASKTVLS